MANPHLDITHHRFSDDLSTATPAELLEYLTEWGEQAVLPQQIYNITVMQILTNLVGRLEADIPPMNAQQEITRLTYRLAIYERAVKAMRPYVSSYGLAECRDELAAVDQLEKE